MEGIDASVLLANKAEMAEYRRLHGLPAIEDELAGDDAAARAADESRRAIWRRQDRRRAQTRQRVASPVAAAEKPSPPFVSEVTGGGCGERGGFPSDTPPATLQGGVDRRTYTGVDTLGVGFGVVWTEDSFRELAEILDDAKARAADQATEDAPVVCLGGRAFVVRATGARPVQGGPVYAWQLEYDGLVVQVMRRPEPSGQTPNVRVQCGAMKCLVSRDLVKLQAELYAVVDGLGGNRSWDKVSRCDWFVDLAGQGVDALTCAYRDDWIVSRAVVGEEYGIHRSGRRITGFRLGRKIMLRVYDKLKELQERSPIKYGPWVEIEWGGEAPEQCTRVEFQVRREKLKTFAVDGLDDLIRRSASILAYLTQQWVRVTDGPVQRGNTERARLHPIWERVIEGFRKLGDTLPAVRVDVRGAVRVKHLVSMARGCFESIAALRAQGVAAVDDFAGMVVDLLYEYCVGDDFAQRVRMKRLELEARYALLGMEGMT